MVVISEKDAPLWSIVIVTPDEGTRVKKIVEATDWPGFTADVFGGNSIWNGALLADPSPYVTISRPLSDTDSYSDNNRTIII